MDAIYQINEFDKALIYSEKNNIMILFLPLKRNMIPGILNNDYRAHLRSIHFNDNIYYVYESIYNEIVYDVAGKNKRTIIFADKSKMWKIIELRLIIVKKQICILYMIYNGVDNKYEIRIMGLEDSKESLYKVHRFEYNVNYEFITVDSNLYLKVRDKENFVNSKFFMINLDNIDEDNLIEYSFCKKSLLEQMEEKSKELIKDNNKEIVKIKQEFTKKQKEIILQKEEQEEELRKAFQIIEKMKMEVNRKEDNLKEKYENDIKIIMKQFEINYEELKNRLMLEHEAKEEQEIISHKNERDNIIKQYEELQEVATNIQNEGKKWRELYLRSIKKSRNNS